MKNYLLFIAVIFFLSACSENQDTLAQEAEAFCLEHNGTVDENSSCVTTEIGIFDEGTLEYTHRCDILDFYNGVCDDGLDNSQEILRTISPNNDTIGTKLYTKVDDILKNLNNTGYIHRPFLLHPDFDELQDEEYNLFLDCSGFVGSYVLQQMQAKLYEDLPRKFSCGPLHYEESVTSSIARPLAADFVNFIAGQTSFREMIEATEQTATDNICWGRVENIKNAKPGDVIAYMHDKNIDNKHQYCCEKKLHKDSNTSYYYGSKEIDTASECATDYGARIIKKTKVNKDGSHKSTGHVMFIMNYPYECLTPWCKSKVNHEWVVHVADSTNVKHSRDSRKVGQDESYYEGNNYHAWIHGALELCENGEYHRKCSDFNLDKNISIDIQGSSERNHPTGLGSGYIFVNESMQSYRVKYSADATDATIIIGRPVECSSIVEPPQN